jgi:pSer/pThr/pTyr-binding forkhead associated (FHA) protein
MSLVASQPIVASDTFILTYGAERGAKGRFPLPRGQTVTIGRALDADLRLPDGLTSRRHAEITVVDGHVVIEDLESANGTFVNGCRVRRAQLRLGDRVLIGVTSLELSLEATGAAPAAPAFQTRPVASARAVDSETTVVSAGRVIAGSVKEISLNDLLQLLSNTRKSGVLSVRNNRATARIYLLEGRIINVTLDGSVVDNAERLLFRVLRWRTGLFELHPADARSATLEAISAGTESLLLAAAQQHDEMLELESVLPSLDAELEVPEALPGDLSALKESEVNALQLFIETPCFGSVVDRIADSDIEAYRLVAGLLRAGYLVARE